MLRADNADNCPKSSAGQGGRESSQRLRLELVAFLTSTPLLSLLFPPLHSQSCIPPFLFSPSFLPLKNSFSSPSSPIPCLAPSLPWQLRRRHGAAACRSGLSSGGCWSRSPSPRPRLLWRMSRTGLGMRAGERVAWLGEGREEWKGHKNSFKAAGAAPLRIWPRGVSGSVAEQPPQRGSF